MNEINDAALVQALRRQMTMSVARQVAASGNLANVDTPGYKAVEPTFSEALDSQMQAGAARPNRFKFASADAGTLTEVKGATARRDGNTVEIDRELLAMNRAAGDFSAAQTALAAKFRLVRYAINEGR